MNDIEAEIELRVRERLARAETARGELAQFVVAVAGELRTPLLSIQGLTRILKNQHAAGLPEGAVECVDCIQANAEEMERMLNGLSRISLAGAREPSAGADSAPARGG